MNIQVIGHIHTQFKSKFGIPRQSGLVEGVTGVIEMLPEFRTPEAFRGLEGYSHIWLLWEFSEAKKENWAATVKPPRLGGNKRMGVFATRSPYRPNSIGLSSVRLDRIEYDDVKGPLLYESGVDVLDGTPIYDIKPYLPYTDSHPEANAGFAGEVQHYELQVVFPDILKAQLPPSMHETVLELLKQDPRPSYQNDPTRRYGVAYGGYDVRFVVENQVLTVVEIEKLKET